MSSSTIPHPDQQSVGSGRSTTTIVVGVDGTDTSWSAFWWACGEARRLGGRVIAVHVTCVTDAGLAAMAWTGIDAGGYMLACKQMKTEASSKLEAELRRIAADLDVRVDFLHLQGEIAEQLLRVARTTRSDMIAVGRSAKVRHRLAGSLGRRLTRERNTPIIVIVP